MRGWTIILIVVLVGWALLIGPPQSLGFLFQHPFSDFWKSLGPLIVYVYTAPGRVVLTWIWPGFFRLTLNQFFAGAPFTEVLIAVFAWGFAFAFSYVFWHFFGARFWKLIGRWNPFGWKITRHRPFFLRQLVRFARWKEREHEFGEHATGAFASLWEVLSNEFKLGDIFLGRPKLYIGGLLRPIGLKTEKHFVTIATTGGYKTSGALIPNLCIHEGSALIIDPKGELARITARRRGYGGGGVRGMKQPTFVMDPFGVARGFQTASYNVFDEMERIAQSSPDRPVTYAGTLAQALIPATNQRDPYWDSAARTLVTGLLLYVLQGPKEQRNLVRFRTLLMEGDTENYKRLGADADRRGDAFDTLMVMMQNCPEGPYRHVIVGAASSLSKMGSNQKGGVLTTAMEHTSFLDIPEFRKTMMKSDFLLEDLKNDFVSVYLCLPINALNGVPRNWLRMFVTLTLEMMTRVAKAPEPPLLLAMDEFPSLGPFDGLPSAAATLRSYGCRLWMIGQDIEQFERVYPDSWGTLIGNAEAIQFMGVTHPPTVAFIAERLAQHVVVTQQDMGDGKTRDFVSERPLRDPDQVARMLAKESKNQIVWYGSKRPMVLKICPYFEYMPWWYYSKDAHREKFNRWIWRRGGDKVPPEIPPKKPPKGAGDKTGDDPVERAVKMYQEAAEEERQRRDKAAEQIPGYFLSPERKKPFERINPDRLVPPEVVNGSEKVPGTDVTWDKALIKTLERITERLEQKADRTELGQLERKIDLSTSEIREEIRRLNPAAYARLEKAGFTSAALDEEMRRSDGGAYYAPVKKDTERFPAGGSTPPARPSERPPETSGGGGPKKPPRGPLEEALAELDGMIGLAGAKEQVRKVIAIQQFSRERQAKGLPRLSYTNHLVFTGNPGTGKTTVARIIGRIYKEMGLLAKGHFTECGRKDLVAEYTGQTAPRTQKVIDKAMDGVLFIDEAYELAPDWGGRSDPYADEAVSTLLKAMEDSRDRFVVIAAGYKDQMLKFINSNPGLESRFKTSIDFENYGPQELLEIFRIMAAKDGLRLSLDAQTAISNLMESLDRTRRTFGNARTVRNIYEECGARLALRMASTRGPKDLTMLEEEDIPKPGEMSFS